MNLSAGRTFHRIRCCTVLSLCMASAACDMLGLSEGSPASMEVAREVSMSPGEVTQLSATVRDQNGRVLDVPVQWYSTNTDIVLIGADGHVHARAPGMVRLMAAAGTDGLRANTTVAVGTIRFDNVVEHAVAEFRRVWGIAVARPAVTLDSISIDTNGPRAPTKFVSVVMGKTYVYHLELRPDGTTSSFLRSAVVPAAGEFHVAVVVMDNGHSNITQVLGSEWQIARDSVNADHRRWSEKAGLKAPLVSFRTTTVVASRDEVNPYSGASVRDYLARKNVTYDIPVVVNQDPTGVRISYFVGGGNGWFIYIACACDGYVEGKELQLTQKAVHEIAFTLYHHEIGHAMGWAHNWSGGPYGTRIITDPALLGWTDVDGDGILEVFDPTPYGAARWP